MYTIGPLTTSNFKGWVVKGKESPSRWPPPPFWEKFPKNTVFFFGSPPLGRSFSITLQMIAAGEWKWKWSNSVLKSEMGIFWCISITNNVKSYKKFDGKAQTAKFTVFAREISSTALKTWKTRKTKTWITQNFQILYHIQGTTMWKSTSSAFQKCGTFCVYDFLKGSYWLSKFSNISIFFDIQNRCQKKRHGHNFEFSEPALNQARKKWVSQALIQWRVRKIKIVAVSFFFDIAYFSWQTHFCCPVLTLSSNNSR